MPSIVGRIVSGKTLTFHAKPDAMSQPKTYIQLQCDGGGSWFKRPTHEHNTALAKGLERHYCSRSCHKKHRYNKRKDPVDGATRELLHQIYERDYGLLFMRALRATHDADEAKDLVHNTFLCLLTTPVPYDSIDHLRLIVRQQLRWHILKQHKAAVPYSFDDRLEIPEEVPEDTVHELVLIALAEEVNRLPPHQAAVATRLLKGMRQVDIYTELGYGKKTLKYHLERLLPQLRQKLAPVMEATQSFT